MNYRTLTDNPQATELINAVRDLKPVSKQDYKGSMEYLQADNASYAALIAKYGVGQPTPAQDSGLDLSPYVVFMFGVLILSLIIKGFCTTNRRLRDSSK